MQAIERQAVKAERNQCLYGLCCVAVSPMPAAQQVADFTGTAWSYDELTGPGYTTSATDDDGKFKVSGVSIAASALRMFRGSYCARFIRREGFYGGVIYNSP